MPTVLFLVDTTGSMYQTAYTKSGRFTFLHLATRAINIFVKRRKKIPEGRCDRYILLTFDEPPHNMKVCWKESTKIFLEEVSLLQAYSFGTIGQNLKHAFDVLNIQKMASADLEPAAIILITEGRKISSPTGILKDLTMPITPPAQWNYTLFALVLRIPGMPIEKEDTSILPPDSPNIEELCKKNGGRSFSINTLNILYQSIKYLTKNLLPMQNLIPNERNPQIDESEQSNAQKVINEMQSYVTSKRLEHESAQTITITSHVNRANAIPSYLVDKTNIQFTDFIDFVIEVEGKSSPNKSFHMDITETPREQLLEKAAYLRLKFNHFNGRESIDEDIKHHIPISDMKNMKAYPPKTVPKVRQAEQFCEKSLIRRSENLIYKKVSPIIFNPSSSICHSLSILAPLYRNLYFQPSTSSISVSRMPVSSSWRTTEGASTSSIVSSQGQAGRKRSSEEATSISHIGSWFTETGLKRIKISEDNTKENKRPSVNQTNLEQSSSTIPEKSNPNNSKELSYDHGQNNNIERATTSTFQQEPLDLSID